MIQRSGMERLPEVVCPASMWRVGHPAAWCTWLSGDGRLQVCGHQTGVRLHGGGGPSRVGHVVGAQSASDGGDVRVCAERWIAALKYSLDEMAALILGATVYGGGRAASLLQSTGGCEGFAPGAQAGQLAIDRGTGHSSTHRQVRSTDCSHGCARQREPKATALAHFAFYTDLSVHCFDERLRNR